VESVRKKKKSYAGKKFADKEGFKPGMKEMGILQFAA